MESFCIHIHLSVANVVEPSPRESGISIPQLLWDRNVELTDAVRARVVVAMDRILTPVVKGLGPEGHQVFGRCSHGTAADDGVDGFPLRLIGGGREVVRDGELARSAAVLGATGEVDQGVRPGLNAGNCVDVIEATLTRERVGGTQWLNRDQVASVEVIGDWMVHDHVAADTWK